MSPNMFMEEGWIPTSSYLEGYYEDNGTDEDDLNDFPFNKSKDILRKKPLPFPVVNYKRYIRKIRTGQRGK